MSQTVLIFSIYTLFAKKIDIFWVQKIRQAKNHEYFLTISSHRVPKCPDTPILHTTNVP